MSRVGKMPIKVPEKVKVLLEGERNKVEGPLGKMDVPVDPLLEIKISDGKILVARKKKALLRDADMD
jgi:large subunit ribosomal protein L6